MRVITIERSVDTDKTVDALRGVNNEISYESLCAATGLPMARQRQVLASARRILEKEGILFGAMWKIGLRRLFDSDKVVQSEHTKKRIGRAASRGVKRLDTISDYDKLSKNEQQTAAINRIVFSVVKAQSRAKPEKILEAVAKPDVEKVASTVAVLKPRKVLGSI